MERNRSIASLFQKIGLDLFYTRHALLIGEDQGVKEDWFKTCVKSAFETDGNLPREINCRDDGTFDFIALNFTLEFIQNDMFAFDQLCRLLSSSGILQICFMDAQKNQATQSFNDINSSPWKTHHIYGGDLVEYFECQTKGIFSMQIEEFDPSTKQKQLIHLFFKSEDEVMRLSKKSCV